MARGFLIGATAGRTTLTGEGLQHADGHSPLLAATNPAVVAYDPAYAYEIGHIVRDGLRRMYGESPEDVYLLPHRLQRADTCSRPSRRTSTSRASCAGMYLLQPTDRRTPTSAPAGADPRLRASPCRGRWRPRQLLRDDWGVAADVWSVTSWSELRRDGLRCDEQAFLQPAGEQAPTPYVTQRLAGAPGPGRRGQRLHAPGAGPDPAVGAAGLRVTRRRRVRLLRHPAGRPAVLPHRRPVDRDAGAAAAGAARRGRPGGCRRRRSSSTGCSTWPPARPATPAARPDALALISSSPSRGSIRPHGEPSTGLHDRRSRRGRAESVSAGLRSRVAIGSTRWAIGRSSSRRRSWLRPTAAASGCADRASRCAGRRPGGRPRPRPGPAGGRPRRRARAGRQWPTPRPSASVREPRLAQHQQPPRPGPGRWGRGRSRWRAGGSACRGRRGPTAGPARSGGTRRAGCARAPRRAPRRRRPRPGLAAWSAGPRGPPRRAGGRSRPARRTRRASLGSSRQAGRSSGASSVPLSAAGRGGRPLGQRGRGRRGCQPGGGADPGTTWDLLAHPAGPSAAWGCRTP